MRDDRIIHVTARPCRRQSGESTGEIEQDGLYRLVLVCLEQTVLWAAVEDFHDGASPLFRLVQHHHAYRLTRLQLWATNLNLATGLTVVLMCSTSCIVASPFAV